MTATIAPEFIRFVAQERRAGRVDAALRPTAEGEVSKPLRIDAGQATQLMTVAARRAFGLYRPSKRNEAVWVDGESELAVNFSQMKLGLADGLMNVVIPVRCDQTGEASVEVTFACGTADAPAGLYAAAPRRPHGLELIVATWGDALVAVAWQCVLGMVTGVAGASGKDQRGNVLVPVEMIVSAKGITIVPMARHRFAGSSGLKPSAGKVG